MGFCVTIHASGVTWALGRIKRHPEYPRFWAGTWLFILVAAWIVMMHLVEIVCLRDNRKRVTGEKAIGEYVYHGERALGHDSPVTFGGAPAKAYLADRSADRD